MRPRRPPLVAPITLKIDVVSLLPVLAHRDAHPADELGPGRRHPRAAAAQTC